MRRLQIAIIGKWRGSAAGGAGSSATAGRSTVWLLMKLWQLLILVCFAAPIGGSFASAQHANVGIGGFALALTVGLVMGAGCSWAMWITHKIVVINVRRRPGWEHSLPQHEWYFRTFYLAKIVWIVFAGFLGAWLSSVLLRLVF